MRLVFTEGGAALDLDGGPATGRALVDEAVDAAVADRQKNVEVALGAGLELGPDQELDDLPDRAVVG